MNKRIGARIRQKRMEFGYTADELASLFGCSRQLVAHYENGACAIPIERLKDYARLCGLPVDWFLMGDCDVLVSVCYL